MIKAHKNISVATFLIIPEIVKYYDILLFALCVVKHFQRNTEKGKLKYEEKVNKCRG